MANGLWSDVRFGIRALRRHSASTLLALLMIAAGVGGATSMFSVLHATLLRPLPFHEPDRLVSLRTGTPALPDDNWSGPDFLDFRDQASLLEAVAASRWQRFALRAEPDPEEVRGASVTVNFFDVLGVAPQAGRVAHLAGPEGEGGRLVVLSDGLWQSRFGASRGIVGTSITLNDQAYTVVAVMPPGFDYPHGAKLWVVSPLKVPEPPFDFGDNPERLRAAHYFDAFARLASGATLASAGKQAEDVSMALAKRYADTNADRRARVVSLLDAEIGSVRSTLWLLAGAVACVLLIGCLNVANILLMRAAGREREVQIRAAVGASGYHLVRQFLVESLLLGLSGGALGVMLSAWGLDALVALVPQDVPRLQNVRIDLLVLGFALLTTLLVSVLAGTAPALHAVRRRGAGPGVAVGNRASSHHSRGALIVIEVAISVVLLLGAGLMVRTLLHLGAVDLGFRTDATVAARVTLPPAKYGEDAQIRAFSRSVLNRLTATRGIVSAGAVMSLPVDAGASADLRVHIGGRPAANRGTTAGFQVAAAGYFETMGIPLVRGRLFTAGDRENRPAVAIVSQAFARQFFPGADPIGERLAWADPANPDTQWFTIVGVVGNTRHEAVYAAPRAEAYVPMAQAPMPYFWFVARGSLGQEHTTRAIRAAVTSVDPGRPLSPIRTLEEVVSRSMMQPRFGTLVLVTFAALALVMAALGLYAVLACGVANRTREIGIRMALGARRLSVVGAVFRDGGRLVAFGLLLGLLGAGAASRLIVSQLHGVQVTDPVSATACLATLAAASALASLVPALRASRIDPAESLRAEP